MNVPKGKGSSPVPPVPGPVIEVEAKAPAGPETRRRLEDRGTVVETVVQEDVYYRHPCRDLAEADEALRVRRTPEGAEWTYKGPRRGGETKTRTEHETAVDDGDAAAAILEALGFEPLPPVRKERTRYDLGAWSATWDEVDGLGTYVEVERLVEAEAEADVADLDAEALALLGELGAGDPEPRSYLELVLDQG